MKVAFSPQFKQYLKNYPTSDQIKISQFQLPKESLLKADDHTT